MENKKFEELEKAKELELEKAKKDKELELEKAKELIAKVEKEKEEKAAELYVQLISEINALGYDIIPEGIFKGNNFKIEMVLIKINV